MKKWQIMGVILTGIILVFSGIANAETTQGLFTRQETIDALNTWDLTQLDAIAGVGPTTAQNIIDFRTANGNFSSVDDLLNVSGIGPTTLNNIKIWFWGADMIPSDEESGGGSGADATGNISVSVVIPGVTSLVVTDEGSDGALDFGSITNVYQKATEYLVVDAVTNYGAWSIEIYTDNFPATTPSTSTWGFAYGGLVDVAQSAKLPLGWCAFDNPFDETPGNPADPNRWSYVKDKSDADDPGTTGTDESWAGRAGYAVVAYGGPGYGTVINPLVTGGDILSAMPVYVYIETAAAVLPGDYSGSIFFDLLHE